MLGLSSRNSCKNQESLKWKSDLRVFVLVGANILKTGKSDASLKMKFYTSTDRFPDSFCTILSHPRIYFIKNLTKNLIAYSK